MQHYEQTFIKKSSEKWSEGQFCVVKGTVNYSAGLVHLPDARVGLLVG